MGGNGYNEEGICDNSYTSSNEHCGRELKYGKIIAEFNTSKTIKVLDYRNSSMKQKSTEALSYCSFFRKNYPENKVIDGLPFVNGDDMKEVSEVLGADLEKFKLDELYQNLSGSKESQSNRDIQREIKRELMRARKAIKQERRDLIKFFGAMNRRRDTEIERMKKHEVDSSTMQSKPKVDVEEHRYRRSNKNRRRNIFENESGTWKRWPLSSNKEDQCEARNYIALLRNEAYNRITRSTKYLDSTDDEKHRNVSISRRENNECRLPQEYHRCQPRKIIPKEAFKLPKLM